MSLLYLDFETRSEANIKKVGGALYAEHPSTSIMCIAYCVDNGEVELADGNDLETKWLPELLLHAENPETIFVAHKADFEMNIWRNHMTGIGYPDIPNERWKCTMAKCYSYGLPGNMEDAAKVLQLPVQKDMAGNKAMLKLSKPRKDRTFWLYSDCPQDFEAMYTYCKGDVIVERLIDQQLRDLSTKERRVWMIDQRMNQTGVYLDRELVGKAVNFIEQSKKDLKEKCLDITGLAPTQREKLKGWFKDNGLELKDMKGPTIKKVLDNPDLPEDLRLVLELRQGATKTSLAKYPTMLQRSTADGLMRENLQYHGAHTGRWAGRGVQLQNLVRPTVNREQALQIIDDLSWMAYGTFETIHDVPTALSDIARGMIVAPPLKRILVADFAQMEARVLAWLAGQQDVLDRFAAGEDLYCCEAEKIYGYPVTPDMKSQRFTGKVAVLSLGYQGGIGALVKMADNYGVDLNPVVLPIWGSATVQEKETADYMYMLYCKRTPGPEQVNKRVGLVADIIKQRWRRGNEKIEAYWETVEMAAIEAIKTGKPAKAGRIFFFVHGKFLHAKLPSGRVTSYPHPKLTIGSKGKITITYHSADKGRITTYGGKLTENLTQAVQRDLLSEALVRLEDAGYPVSLHVHDETICYMDEGVGDLDEYMEIMKQPPAWAAGIPVDVEGWEGYRYGKE